MWGRCVRVDVFRNPARLEPELILKNEVALLSWKSLFWDERVEDVWKAEP